MRPSESQDVTVRVIARAQANEIVGERNGGLLVRVTAPPVEGRANSAVCRLIAKRAGVAVGAVTVVRRASSRDKVVRVEGITSEDLRRSLVGG